MASTLFSMTLSPLYLFKIHPPKKAYTDIILNTTKEAMARIMVSERKATCFQQELISTKEEALRKLLRLKQMFDSKMAPMHVNHAREVPEYEINPKELDLTNSVEIMKEHNCCETCFYGRDYGCHHCH
ncbi:hypothetical protein AAZX31_18G142500 [Glycine max]|uniref:uncharacterized protein LOC114404599 n=1 Tax=Glycine soja TaxID=3848 RepID=UPI0003DEAD5F|nr:uncharacterized protein LOC114404599 [Glycine soja]KAG4377571.1 hypothetical protein GLYMA_18G155150v4 [Glycine max]KAH1154684.1 hypothetical protein GYH30_050106 [Glycine max]|eukprot:XP_014626276.1 uncharacterized protein LOC102660572 [Glycine max]